MSRLARAFRRIFRRPWLRHYVASKLRSDPVFPAAWELLHQSAQPVLDVGCGVGLLPFYLRERGFEQPIFGLDVDVRKVREATALRRSDYAGVSFIEHDVAQQLADFSGNVALLDVLHYLAPQRQADASFRAARAAFLPAPAAAARLPARWFAAFLDDVCGRTFRADGLVEPRVPLHFPTRDSINASFAEQEFARAEEPAYGGTPFNNRLFIFRRSSPQSMNYAASVSDFFKTPKWGLSLALGAVAILIPIAGWMVVTGWAHHRLLVPAGAGTLKRSRHSISRILRNT